MPNCPECGAELGSGDPAGLCPKCLILGAFDSSIGAEEAVTETIDTATAAAGDDDFGRYRIVRSLGEGGVGTVYLAEQREPIRRRVALKVVKPGMDTAQVLARFNNEHQALAMMEHPSIALDDILEALARIGPRKVRVVGRHRDARPELCQRLAPSRDGGANPNERAPTGH